MILDSSSLPKQNDLSNTVSIAEKILTNIELEGPESSTNMKVHFFGFSHGDLRIGVFYRSKNFYLYSISLGHVI